MQRRAFLRTAGAGLAALTLPQIASAARKRRKPNIIYLLADDLGYQELGCYGQKIIRTPNIDRIAAEGMLFTQHYSGSAVCAPARCMLMTGKHSGHSYIRGNGNPAHRKNPSDDPLFFPGQHPIPASEITIAEVLKGKGYATGAMGKWGLGYEGSTGDPNNQGFDLFYGFLCQVHAHNHYPRFLWKNGKKEMLPGNDRTLYGKTHSQDRFIEEGLDFIDASKDQPFFLYMPFAIPHLSIQVPEKDLNEYTDEIKEEEYKHRGYLPHPKPRAGYAAMITYLDKGVGQIMKRVADLGLDNDTIIIFSSDNGPTYNRLGGSDSDYFESAGEFRGLKGSLYEGGIRVPLVARWPGKIKPGSTTDHQCAFWDILPTFADLAGAQHPKGIDGVSFLPTLLEKGKQQPREYLYWEYPEYGGQQAIRIGDWKGIRQDMFKGNMEVELYNLKKDPSEKNNVAADHPDLVKKIEHIMATDRVDSELFPLFRSQKKKPAQIKQPDAKGTVPRKNWKLLSVDSESTGNRKLAINAFDGNPDTWWHTDFSGTPPKHPHEIVIDMGKVYTIKGFRQLPRADGGTNGMIRDYEFYASEKLDNFGAPAAKGAFKKSSKEQEVKFPERQARYIRLRALSEQGKGPFTSVSEIAVLGK